LYVYPHKIKFGDIMYRIQLDKDIQPLSEFRSKVALYFDKVKKNKRPLIITQNGKSAAVLLAVSEYEAMIDKIEVLEDIKLAEAQIGKGLEIPHQEVKKRFIKRS
jgi:antitoxin YefM